VITLTVVLRPGGTAARAPDHVPNPADWTIESHQARAGLGWEAGTAGDVNGDGYDDVIVSAPYFTNGEAGEGRAYVYEGGPSGLRARPAWTVDGNQVGANLGRSVGGAGDVNGDGYDDVVVATPLYDDGETDSGRAFLYLGSPSGPAPDPSWTAGGNQLYEGLGNSAAGAGDVNGDGFDDLIVGASGYSDGQDFEGAAFAYYGSPSGLPATPSWIGESNQADAFLGVSVGSAGDVNGDGYDDVIAGAPNYDGGQGHDGAAFVYLGSPSGLSTAAGWMATGGQAADQFGDDVGTAGDVNGDGFDDVIVGANYWSHNEDLEGGAFVYDGSAFGPSPVPDWTVEGDQPGAQLGQAVGTAGDVDGDGFDDVMVGALLFDHQHEDEGAAYLFMGSARGLGLDPRVSEGNQRGGAFGSAVGTAGDVNGDGLDDIVVGAVGFDHGKTDEGAAFATYGPPA
jgi:hypothetical protein